MPPFGGGRENELDSEPSSLLVSVPTDCVVTFRDWPGQVALRDARAARLRHPQTRNPWHDARVGSTLTDSVSPTQTLGE
jgi:hypothetical protein